MTQNAMWIFLSFLVVLVCDFSICQGQEQTTLEEPPRETWITATAEDHYEDKAEAKAYTNAILAQVEKIVGEESFKVHRELFSEYLSIDKDTFVKEQTATHEGQQCTVRIDIDEKNLSTLLTEMLANPKPFREKVARHYCQLGKEFEEKRWGHMVADCYTKAISFFPDFLEAYRQRGLFYYNQGQYDSGISDFSKIIELDPENANAFWNRGACYENKKSFAKAIEDYSTALRLLPQEANLFHNRANCYSALKEYDKALSDFASAIQLNPNNANFYSNRGIVYFTNEKYDLAIEDFSKALSLNSSHINAIRNRGLSYYNLGKYDEAIEDFSKAIESYYDAWQFYMRGYCYMNKKKYNAAIEDFTSAIDIQAEAHYLAGRAWAFWMTQDYKNALDDYQLALSFAPNDFGCLADSGNLLYEMGKVDEAIENCSKAIEIEKHFVPYLVRGNAYSHKGQIEHDQGNIEKAQELFAKSMADHKKSFELQPETVAVYDGRALSYIHQQQYDNAIADCNKALEIGQEAESYVYRALAYIYKEQYEQALADIDKALSINPQSPHAYSYRGFLHFRQKDYERALADFDKALEICPEHDWGKTKREQLLEIKNKNKYYLVFQGMEPQQLSVVAQVVNKLKDDEQLSILANNQENRYCQFYIKWARDEDKSLVQQTIGETVAAGGVKVTATTLSKDFFVFEPVQEKQTSAALLPTKRKVPEFDTIVSTAMFYEGIHRAEQEPIDEACRRELLRYVENNSAKKLFSFYERDIERSIQREWQEYLKGETELIRRVNDEIIFCAKIKASKLIDDIWQKIKPISIEVVFPVVDPGDTLHQEVITTIKETLHGHVKFPEQNFDEKTAVAVGLIVTTKSLSNPFADSKEWHANIRFQGRQQDRSIFGFAVDTEEAARTYLRIYQTVFEGDLGPEKAQQEAVRRVAMYAAGKILSELRFWEEKERQKQKQK